MDIDDVKNISMNSVDVGDYKTDKIRVEGGWIYRTIICARFNNGVSAHTSMVFVPEEKQ